ncbi:hypothetical protein [Runella sp.]|jgi:hypothetical protein|uniref:hypothetical protein n=1 Tax=Runella sp. TaxID=1960881 RepID=UPI00260E1609|nr:hypothetical protein [Runella sp.]
MKIIYFMVLVRIVSINPLFAQRPPSKSTTDYTQNLPCNCESYTRRYVEDAKTAQSLINDYLKAIAKNSKIRTSSDPIYVLEANCGSPMAALCPGDIRLILFNKYFFELINAKDVHTVTLVDKHVLAHELGHHVLGHFKRIGSLSEVEKIYQKEKGYLKKKFITNNNPMAQEIEADLFALWLLYKLEKGFQAEMLIAQIDTMKMEELDKRFMKQKENTNSVKNTKEEKSYSTHPFFSDRIKIMRQYQNTIKNLQTTTGVRGFNNLGNSAFMDLWPSRAYWDISLSAGVVLGGIPDFSADGQKVAAFMYALNQKTSFHTGLSLTRFRWDKPWQTTLDVHWSKQHYGTTFLINDSPKLAEELHLDYLTLSPQIGWNSAVASRRGSLSASKRGLLVNVGANFFFPIGALSYTNYIATSAPVPKLRFSAMPKVSVGVAFTKKTFLPRNLKWLVSYEPQWIRLEVTPRPTAISHNFTTTLQYAILRR